MYILFPVYNAYRLYILYFVQKSNLIHIGYRDYASMAMKEVLNVTIDLYCWSI